MLADEATGPAASGKRFTFQAMKKKRAIELQAVWGDRPCPHPALAKEYDLGARTGNFICTQCGRVLSFRERAELKASRAAPDTED